MKRILRGSVVVALTLVAACSVNSADEHPATPSLTEPLTTAPKRVYDLAGNGLGCSYLVYSDDALNSAVAAPTWAEATPYEYETTRQDAVDFAVDPQNASRGYLLTAQTFFTTDALGDRSAWVRRLDRATVQQTFGLTDAEAGDFKLTNLAVHPTSPGLLAVALHIGGFHGNRVLSSRDGGATWHASSGASGKGYGAGGSFSAPTDLVFCPNSESAYLAVRGTSSTHLWRSSSGADAFEERFYFDKGLPAGFGGGKEKLTPGPSCELYAYSTSHPVVVYRNGAPQSTADGLPYLPLAPLGRPIKMSYGELPRKLQMVGSGGQNFVLSGTEGTAQDLCFETNDGGSTFLPPRPCGKGSTFAIVPDASDTQIVGPSGTREHTIMLYTPAQPAGVRRSVETQRNRLPSVARCGFVTSSSSIAIR